MSDKIFLDVVNMSITGSFAILIIILVRLLLRKAPKVFSYTLWFVAFFRLLVPFSFESVLSILPFNTMPLSTDMLYKQYKDQYQTLGAQAMMDTMGQAAALTGGYGSSYASTAGNQAYQGYLQQLNNIVPGLYSQALNRYNSELDKLANTYSMVLQQYNDEEAAKDKEYAVLADKYNAFNQQYGDEYNRNYGKWSDDYNRWLTGAQLSNDDYWQNQNLAEQQRQFNAQMAEDQRQFNANLAYQREADNYANQLSQLQNELQSQIDGTYSYSMAKEAASQSPQALVDYLDSTNLDDATKDSIYNSFFKNYTKSFLYNLGQKKLSDIRQNAREKK